MRASRLPGVDPDRIVLWGTSWSGGHVVYAAAADPRIAAVIAQYPDLDGSQDALDDPRLRRGFANSPGSPGMASATASPPSSAALPI